MSIGAPDYREYINSEAWRSVRQRALQRATVRGRYMSRPSCEVCGLHGYSHKNRHSDDRYRVDYSNGPNVHHLHYRNLGSENPEDLIVLCTDGLYYGRYDRFYKAWRDKMMITPGDWSELKKVVGEPPEMPSRVGCHERVHDDPAFRREVQRIAAERDW